MQNPPQIIISFFFWLALVAVPLNIAYNKSQGIKKVIVPTQLNLDGNMLFREWMECYSMSLRLTQTSLWLVPFAGGMLATISGRNGGGFRGAVLRGAIAGPQVALPVFLVLIFIGFSLWKHTQARNLAGKLGLQPEQVLKGDIALKEKWLKPEARELATPKLSIETKASHPAPEVNTPQTEPSAQPVPLSRPVEGFVNTISCPHCGVIFEAKGLPGEHKFQCPDETCRRLLQVTFY